MEDIAREIDGSKHQRTITKNILDQIFQNVTWARHDEYIEVLDIGCGPGVVTKDILVPKLPRNFKEVVGMDMRKSYINYANNTYQDEKVNFIQMDIQYGVPRHYEERFDLVTSFLCLQELTDQEDALECMLNCVRPVGHFILTFEITKEYDEFLDGMRENPRWVRYIRKRKPLKRLKEDIEPCFDIIRRSGFKIIHGEYLKCERPRKKKQYMAYLKSVDTCGKNIPPMTRKKYFNYLEEHLVNKNSCPEDPDAFMFKYTTLVVHAVKE